MGHCCLFHFRPAYFKIIEEVISQIVLHKSGLDPDFKKNHIDIDLQPLLDELKGRLVFIIRSSVADMPSVSVFSNEIKQQ